MNIICKHCASAKITRDASALWDAGAQEWRLAGVQDHITCEDCGAENSAVEVFSKAAVLLQS
jgi:hypothetical protein